MLIPTKHRKPFVIAIANGKGGVGKTTTALAIGTILARRGLKILVIDLDPQGNLTLSLGHKPHKMPVPPAKMPTDGTVFAGDTFLTKHVNLHLVFARSLIVDKGFEIQVNTADDLFFLGQDLSVIKTLSYDYVIIDCPPSMAALTTVALTAADLTIIPTQCEYFAIQAINTIFSYIRQVRGENNPQLRFKLLITMFDRRGKLHTQLYERLKAHYNTAVFETIIGFDSKLRAAQVAGQPITIFAPKTRAARQYRDLAKEIKAYVQERRL